MEETFWFECRECGTEFEVSVDEYDEGEVVQCPECQAWHDFDWYEDAIEVEEEQ